jgi:multiple sugar transport system permease protein
VLLCLPAIMPMTWMVATSLKTNQQLFPKDAAASSSLTLSNLLPHPVDLQNYPDALKAVPFRTYLRNTVFLCAVTVFGVVFSSAMVAYGFARLQFFGKSALFIAMISTMAVPDQVTMVPVFALYRAFGWYGTYLPLTVPAFCGGAFYIFLLTQFYKTIPEELAEAARVDGSSEWRIFTRVILPLSRPALATIALFQFIATWNDFLGPLIYLNDPKMYTVAYGLQQFVSKNTSQWTFLMAGATLFTLPVIILFFFAQKTFIQGIATTGGRN